MFSHIDLPHHIGEMRFIGHHIGQVSVRIREALEIKVNRLRNSFQHMVLIRIIVSPQYG